ncbi:hypothetical protein [Demequina capsici]|uniref:Uncharacterized protein n=1 Tax=Demequina capsici TaxID=3075620 RepID=A0AA96J7E7_9MICO|nr:hypothetical protein [Demequina sp. OYTSA14]WNM24285.1 hypothetical protein RN606_13120 [Demequina sp. OYTSA14]
MTTAFMIILLLGVSALLVARLLFKDAADGVAYAVFTVAFLAASATEHGWQRWASIGVAVLHALWFANWLRKRSAASKHDALDAAHASMS